ncbi:MAG TPA: prenyltransferase/squalene oxidase repeat-containing protein [Solirubrobacteraceae bacterium]|nr:prenyltransferase/squalene oxidase repeat-containing protein [Solirubrobacteraceae bacterium]
MSWQIGAFVLLALALGGGFVWYERARPDARIVALVATLAAFAALGRIAFAAVPNVKPTTDIVLISGYALGGAPGFAVGALAGLSSNFFFGQGPWTPWQMAAWGMTGVIGASLAWGMRGRAIGRWPLAVVCCVIGFAFTAVQDVGDWVTYSDHSVGALGVYVGQGLGFDAVHAGGCLVFALAMGPALIRSIQRFARRLQVTWVPVDGGAASPPRPGTGAVAGASGSHEGAGPAWAAIRRDEPAQRAKSGFAAEIWRRTGPMRASCVKAHSRRTIWHDMHVPQAGHGLRPVRGVVFDPTWRRRIAAAGLLAIAILTMTAAAARAAAPAPAPATAAAASYLLSAENADGGFGAAPGQASSQLFTGWAALGLAAAGHDLNLVTHGGAGLMTYVRGAAGATADVGSLERTILVVDAAGLSARHFGGHDLVAELERRIGAGGAVSDQVNLTSFAILALRGAGAGGAAVGRAQRWLSAEQDRDGGFSFATAGSGSDVDDTGAALEALAGDPSAAAVRARAVGFLRRQQDRDGGFPSQPGTGSNAQSTAWAIQGLDAAGVSPAGLHRAGSPSPLAYLASLAAPSGLIRYGRGQTQTPVWVTGEALMAMEGKPLPVLAPPPPPRSATSVHRAGTPAHRAAATASSPGTAPSARGSSRSGAHRRSAHRPAARPAAGQAQPPSMDRLASTAGALTALLLAPLGLG